MLEEGANQDWIFLDCVELLADALLHGLSGLEGVARYAGSLGMTSHQSIGIELKGIAKQETKLQFSSK